MKVARGQADAWANPGRAEERELERKKSELAKQQAEARARARAARAEEAKAQAVRDKARAIFKREERQRMEMIAKMEHDRFQRAKYVAEQVRAMKKDYDGMQTFAKAQERSLNARLQVVAGRTHLVQRSLRQLHRFVTEADPEWVADKEAPTCKRCDAKFTLFTRRHHCRLCGECICSKCYKPRLWAEQKLICHVCHRSQEELWHKALVDIDEVDALVHSKHLPSERAEKRIRTLISSLNGHLSSAGLGVPVQEGKWCDS